MPQLIALGLAFLGLAIPLVAIFYFAKKREKRDRDVTEKGRGGQRSSPRSI